MSNPKTTTIKAGYRVTISSWENDGDHSQKNVTEGLTLEQVEILSAVAQISQSGDSNLENCYEPSEQDIETGYEYYLSEFAKKPELFTENVLNDIAKNSDTLLSYIRNELSGHSVEGYALRVLEDILIEYIPEEIKIKNVTKQFIH